MKKKQLKKIEIFDDLSDEDTTPQSEGHAGLHQRVIQKPKLKVAPVAIQLKVPPVQPVAIDPYDEFKKKFNIR